MDFKLDWNDIKTETVFMKVYRPTEYLGLMIRLDAISTEDKPLRAYLRILPENYEGKDERELMETIKQIIETHRDWHPAWILEAIGHYIKTGDDSYDPRKEQRVFYRSE